jgi:hypothetical protein
MTKKKELKEKAQELIMQQIANISYVIHLRNKKYRQ